MQKIVQARITGRVQGVAYRAWTRAAAEKLGLTGWVRNRDDGSVLAHLEGDRARVDELLTLMWQGPGAARVQDVQAEDAAREPGLSGFEIRR
jgi:acylphosphatase